MPAKQSELSLMLLLVCASVTVILLIIGLFLYRRQRQQKRESLPCWMARMEHCLRLFRRRRKGTRTSSGSCILLVCPTCTNQTSCHPSSLMTVSSPVTREARAMQQRKWLLSKGIEHFIDLFVQTRQLPCVTCGKLFQAAMSEAIQTGDLREALQLFLDERDATLEDLARRARVESLV